MEKQRESERQSRERASNALLNEGPDLGCVVHVGISVLDHDQSILLELLETVGRVRDHVCSDLLAHDKTRHDMSPHVTTGQCHKMPRHDMPRHMMA